MTCSRDKNSTCRLVITSEIKKGRVILPKVLIGRVLWEEFLEGEGEKSKGETSIFLVLTVVIIWDAVLKLTG